VKSNLIGYLSEAMRSQIKLLLEQERSNLYGSRLTKVLKDKWFVESFRAYKIEEIISYSFNGKTFLIGAVEDLGEFKSDRSLNRILASFIHYILLEK
jgi:hypothetical protein